MPLGNSQITESVENVVYLHVDIPHTGGRGFDLPFEDVLQEYLQFPYKYLFVLLLTVENFVLQITPEETITRSKVR
jgi:hypothetical protein